MLDLLKTLRLKDITDAKLIVNAPSSYYSLLDTHCISYDTEADKLAYDFIQIFGFSNDELLQLSSLYIEYLKPDGIFWLMYPNKESKRYRNETVTKDTVENLLREYRYQPVRHIVFDEDFSGIQFEPFDKSQL